MNILDSVTMNLYVRINYRSEFSLRYYYTLNRFCPDKSLFKGLSNIKFAAPSYILSMPGLELFVGSC